MKILLPFLLLLCYLANGQSQSAEPFKKANLVLITFDTMSVNNAFVATGKALIDQGFTISKSDANFKTIETNVRSYKGNFNMSPVSVIIRASVKSTDQGKTEVKLSSVFGIGIDSNPTLMTEYRGMKGGAYIVSFEKMIDVARVLEKQSPGVITYSAQQ